MGGIAGDYNDNGIVDAADYTVWRNHSGEPFQLLNEGPDTPGEVTIEDYNFWKANFGLGGPGAGSGSTSGGILAGSGSAAVPEPGALALLLGATGNPVFAAETWRFAPVFGVVKKALITLETA